MKTSTPAPIDGHPHRRRRVVRVRVRKQKRPAGQQALPALLQSLPVVNQTGLVRPLTALVGGAMMTPSTVTASSLVLDPIFETLEIPPDDRAALVRLNTLTPKDPQEWMNDEAGNLLAASFEQLVFSLTNPDLPNVEFQSQFLITFASFTTPYKVFAAILVRFFSDFSLPGSNVRSNQHLKQVRDRVIRILSTWAKIAPFQFDDKLMAAVDQFITYLVNDSTATLTAQILSATFAQIKGGGTKNTVTQKVKPAVCPLPKTPQSQWTLTEIDPIEIARQVTLYHSEIFLQLGRLELLTAIWGATRGGGSPHVDELTKHFDIFSRYISLSVIEGPTPAARAKTMIHWIECAIEFKSQNNYHGVFAVVCALTHTSVARMWETEKHVNKMPGAKKKAWIELKALCDFSGDYAIYRPVIAKTVNPAIPFVGCFQKDLIYVQEGYPNKINGLINFKKCVACSKLIGVVEKFVPRYFYEQVPRIQELLRNIPEPPDTIELMRLSISKEKKKK